MNAQRLKSILSLVGILMLVMIQVSAAEGVSLFDGKTLNGWEGDTKTWRAENGAIVAGDISQKQPHNDFLATTREFEDFELRLQYKIEGS
ncbi:MAG TPA: DUF1080 domain-containing protein, partial [Verrucomicrobiae bacterium]|nr:DUF1080 domain-containing protein [Verrucomicrobiae bacterium]